MSEQSADVVRATLTVTTVKNNTSEEFKGIDYAVKRAFDDANDKHTRSFRLIIHVLETCEELVDAANDLVSTILDYKVPIISATPINNKTGEMYDHIFGQLHSADVVTKVLKNAGRLKATKIYRTTYLSPDRTSEERKEHRNLVTELKVKILLNGSF